MVNPASSLPSPSIAGAVPGQEPDRALLGGVDPSVRHEGVEPLLHAFGDRCPGVDVLTVDRYEVGVLGKGFGERWAVTAFPRLPLTLLQFGERGLVHRAHHVLCHCCSLEAVSKFESLLTAESGMVFPPRKRNVGSTCFFSSARLR